MILLSNLLASSFTSVYLLIMSSSDDEVIMAAIILHHNEKLKAKKRKKRSVWAKEWLKRRNDLSHMSLIRTLENNHSSDFKNYLRMPEDLYTKLLNLVKPVITKQHTVMRAAISAEERLAATLRYLAAGTSLENLKFSTVISAPALCHIIPETCQAIIDVLKDEYMKFPETSEEWMKIAKDFKDLWQFPNCGGAIDGKHIRIILPPNSGSYYYNYKHFHSIVLMAVVDANLEFIFVDIGKNGRVSDGGVLRDTKFMEKLQNGQLNLPSSTETEEGFNYVFIGDDAFSLHSNLLKPFPQKNLVDPRRKIFNYRLSRARRVVENAFGVLASRFRIFHQPITLSPEKTEIIVMASCMLHNFLRRNNRNNYTPAGFLDREDIETGTMIQGDWRADCNGGSGITNLERCRGQNFTADAKENREKYVDYFSGTGAVSWQERMVFRST